MIIGLIAILLVAVGLLIMQNYLVYDDTGKAHWEFPLTQQKEEKEDAPAVDPDDVEIQREEPVSTVGKDLSPLQAQELPLWCLNDDPTWLLKDAPQSVVVNVKTTDGALTYASKVTAPDSISKGDEGTATNLRTILDSQHNVVARMACLCDSAYAYEKVKDAALCWEDGSLWWDNYGRYWLDPGKADTLRYVKELCQECATLGFDEIVLDYFAYPAEWEGSADRGAVLTQFVTDLREALPEGTRLSVLLRDMPSTQNGMSADLLCAGFDRIFVDNTVDAAALKATLPADFDAVTRLVPIVWEAAESGSYMIATN